ncbi:HAD family phosphatase [Aerococcaceae bacterium DSM 111020]|nr:HAD family phosphatase [Aerococcaceae bacterium DSM 111020]
MTLKLISIDLDSTLLRDDKTYEVDRFKKAIEKLALFDVMVTIITGNGYQKVTEYFDQEELQSLYFCCDNGNKIIKNNELLHSFIIDEESVYQVLSYLEAFPGYAPVLSIDGVGFMTEENLPFYDALKQFNPDLHIVEEFKDAPIHKGVVKIAIYSNEPLECAKQMITEINEKFTNVSAVTSGHGWLDVYHRDGGKGAAVRYLQEKYHIKSEESMALGDSLNDAPMMKNVLYSVSMANADIDLVKLTQYQIGTNEDQAVVSLLEQILQDPALAFIQQYKLH